MLHEPTGLQVKPCPFCNYDGHGTNVVRDCTSGAEHAVVECGGCGAFGPPSNDFEMDAGADSKQVKTAQIEAIEKWNAAHK